MNKPISYIMTKTVWMRIPRKSITDSTVIAISRSTPIRSGDAALATREDGRYSVELV
jgi:hypothetical protein